MLNWIVLNRTDYLHKMDLELDNRQRLICHKTQQTNQQRLRDAPDEAHGLFSEYIWFQFRVFLRQDRVPN